MSETADYVLWQGSQPIHEGGGPLQQAAVTDRTGALGGLGLEIPLERLVRVGLWCVGRQEDQFDLLLRVGKPFGHFRGVMHVQVVDDQEDYLWRAL